MGELLNMLELCHKNEGNKALVKILKTKATHDILKMNAEEIE